MNKPVPMNLETQHYVMCPSGDNEDLRVEPIYALSPEAAVEEVKRIYTSCERTKNVDKIRLAVGEELPWNNPAAVAFVVTTAKSFVVTFGDEKTVRENYDFMYQGKPYELRPATAEEKEMSIRLNQVDDDLKAEEEFDYGFNVLYPQMRDEGLL